jgi:TPR repeat protein
MPNEFKVPSNISATEAYELAQDLLDDSPYTNGCEFLMRAANMGSAMAQCALGVAHLYGLYGLEKNANIAVSYFFSAAKINSLDPNSSVRAFKELKKLVEIGESKQEVPGYDISPPSLANAKSYLAICYRRGYGTAIDKKQAELLSPTTSFKTKELSPRRGMFKQPFDLAPLRIPEYNSETEPTIPSIPRLLGRS